MHTKNYSPRLLLANKICIFFYLHSYQGNKWWHCDMPTAPLHTWVTLNFDPCSLGLNDQDQETNDVKKESCN